MIDGHVHAFPSLGDRLPGLVGRRVKRATTRVARALGTCASVGGQLGLVSVERTVALQNALPAAARRAVESATCVAVLPPMLVGGTVDGLLASMSRAGIRRSLVIGSAGVASNEWLLEAVRDEPRLVPVATAPPMPEGSTEAAWTEAWRRTVDAGAAGLKLHPSWDGIGPDHPATHALFEVAAVTGCFVILHTGGFHVPTYRTKGPVPLHRFADHFQRHRDVRVCLAHMNRDEPEEAWELMKRFDQLYADTSWQPTRTIRRALDTVGAERIMLGSDWPLLHLGLQSDARRCVEKAARTTNELEDVVEGAAGRFTGDAA
jgi:predicted TIM-barrel fold metal-dependent hydrolase